MEKQRTNAELLIFVLTCDSERYSFSKKNLGRSFSGFFFCNEENTERERKKDRDTEREIEIERDLERDM